MSANNKCFFCNTTCRVDEIPSLSYTIKYSCEYCGEYLLDRQDSGRLSGQTDNRFKIACVLNERRLKKLGGIALNDKTDVKDKVLGFPRISVDDVLNEFPSKASELLNRTLLNLSRLSERPFDVIELKMSRNEDGLHLFTSNLDESKAFLQELAEQKYIRFNKFGSGYQWHVFFRTTKFWEIVERLKEEHLGSKNALDISDSPQKPADQKPKIGDESLYDIFVSHATEDKDAIVRPLVNSLDALGLRVWYDEFELKLGDSLRQSIDNGLAKSKYGLVILSHSFFNKNWPKYELDGLVNRQMAGGGGKVILPIWHGITKEEVSSYSPALADKVALDTANSSIDDIVKEIMEVVNIHIND